MDKGLLICQKPKGVLGGANWVQFSVSQGGMGKRSKCCRSGREGGIGINED